MKHFMHLFLILPLLFAAPAFSAGEVPSSFADLVEKLSPAVVNVSTTQKIKGGAPGMQMFGMPEGGEVPEEFRHFFDQLNKGEGEEETEREVYSLGSGFIIDESGYVVTNNHVINDAEEITVILSDNTKLKAKIIGRDAKTDLALLKVDAGHKLPAVTLGDSDAARVGDWVIAIGNPFGLGGTVTAGIISARARNINAGPFDDFIQTDAAINRGNSGGPMFNMKGEVIGINTAIYSPSGGSVGIGFAVPSSLAKPVIEALKTRGHIDRGWLGVRIQDVTDEIADSLGLKKTVGALVMEVTKGGPAEKAGIKIGDVITSFDGKEIKAMHFLPRIVADTKIGKTVALEVWRKGETMTLHATVGELKEKEVAANGRGSEEEQPETGAEPKTKVVLGLSLASVDSQAREHYGLGGDVRGVIVIKVKPASEATKRGVHPGDVITQIGETPVGTPADVSSAVAAARAGGHKFVLVRITRGAESMFITLPVSEEKK